MNWKKGRKLLEPPYSLSEDGIFKAVHEGNLVPYESPDADFIKRRGYLEPHSERIWRYLPTLKLDEKYKHLLHLQDMLDRAQKWVLISDEEHIDAYKNDLNIGWGGGPPCLTDLETYASKTLPMERQKYLQIIQEYPPQIEELEGELAPDKAWKDLGLEAVQKEVLMEKLLDAFYELDRVESLSKTQSRGKKPKTQNIKEKVREKASALWEKDPTITIAYMAYEHLADIAKKPNGSIYADGTIRKWIKDLCPDRSRGRRPKK